MAVKRKSSPPRSPVQLHKSDEDSSSEEEQRVAQPIPSLERDDDESDFDSGSDSDPDPPTKTPNLPLKPLEFEDSSDEEDDEQEIVEKLKSPAKEPESKPVKKKLKFSDPDQSLSTKLASAVQRIWSPEDEMALLRALSEYHSRNGKLPPTKDYASFISGISGSIGFPVTEKQLSNKIRQMKYNFVQKIKKEPDVKILKPREKAVFKMCAKLFEDSSSKASKSRVSVETNRDAETENGVAASGGKANGGVVNSGAANGDAVPRSNFYLRLLIEDLISRQQCLSWRPTIKDMVARMGESGLQDLEAKAKMLRIDTIKLQAREEKLKAELLDIVAEGMADD